MARAQNNRREERNALTIHQPRLPAPPADVLKRFGLQPSGWKTLVEAVWPSAKTVDGVAMALDYCQARKLDPFKKPVHIVPMWNSTLNQEVETVWPGINDYRTTASRTGVWAGNDDCLFGPRLKRKFEQSVQKTNNRNEKYTISASCPEIEFYEWAQFTVYKIMHGQRVPFVGPKVYFMEIFSGQKGLRVPNERWQQSPNGMLEKCAEAAALRRAFPEEFAGTYTAEEMEGKTFHGGPTIDAEAVYHDEPESAGDERPTRESVLEPWEQLGIRKEIWERIESCQVDIDQTHKVDPLKKAKEHFVDLGVADGWTEAELNELEKRFDDRIRELQPPTEQELPLDGDDAGASRDEDTAGENEEGENGDKQTD